MRTLQDLKDLIKAETSRAHSLKTKKAQSKAWTRVRGLDREACSLLYAECENFAPQSIQATVLTFSSSNDDFLVETPFGNVWVSPTADVSSKSWYSHTCCIEYSVGQKIVIEFHTEVNTDRHFLELVPGKMYGGTINEIKYAELDKRTDLAFFKHSTGGMTGLFSNEVSK